MTNSKSEGDLVERYLSAGRITSDPRDLTGEIVARHHESFEDVLARLGLDELDQRPRLYVTRTANAVAETLTIGPRDIVVYDVYLGQAFDELTDFALADWPTELVLSWGMRRLAIAFASLGDYWLALAADHLAGLATAADRPDDRCEATAEQRHLRVSIQEHFILAHECVHAALRRNALAEPFRRSAEDLVADAIEAAASTRFAETQADVLAAVVDDEIRAINKGSRFYRINDAERAAILDRRRHQHLDFGWYDQWVDEQPHLKEEITCDFIATDLTVARFEDLGVQAAEVLEGILHGFKNHGAMETIRAHARLLQKGRTSPSPTEQVATRSVVWRTAAPDVWGHYTQDPDPETFRRRMDAVVDVYRRSVGDQVTYTLLADFTAAVARVPDPPAVPRQAVVDSIIDAVDFGARLSSQ